MGEVYDLAGQIEPALKNINRGLQIFLEIRDEKGSARAYNSRGLARFYANMELEQARKDFIEAKFIAEKIHDLALLAKIFHNLAQTHQRLQELPEALKAYLRARNLKDSLVAIGYPGISAREQVSTYNNLSVFYQSVFQFDKARETSEKALELIPEEELGRRAAILLNLGIIEHEDSNYNAALRHLDESLQLAQQGGFTAYQPNIYNAIGNAHLELESVEAASDNYELALEILKDINLPDVKAGVVVDQADMFLRQNRYLEAKSKATEALEIIQGNDNIGPEKLLQAHEVLAKVAEAQDDFPAAAYHLRKYADAQREQLKAEHSQEYIGLQASYDVDLNTSRYELRLKEQELAISEKWVFWLKIAVAIAAFLALAFAYAKMKETKAKKEVEETNEQLEEMNIKQADTNQKLSLANNKIQQFAFATGHDLKESLRNITSFTQLASIEMAQDTQQAQAHLKEAAAGGKRMRKMLDDLLHYSNIGGNDTRITKMGLDEVIGSVKQQLKTEIEACRVGPIVLLGLYDMFQDKHAIMRNFPILGRGRYVMEELRPKLYQYFIESDTNGRPINRVHRSVVYQRAKEQRDTTPFGTQLEVYEEGYEWMNHSIAALDAHELSHHPRTKVGSPDCKQPYEASLFNVSAMSFGSLSSAAIEALNGGAKMGNFAHNTGEGGVSPYHETFEGDLVWQIGTGYFGCRADDGGFDPDKFAERSQTPNIKMIELKLSQGADATYSARAMMLALGCIQALECNKNSCPTGVATQDPELVAGLVAQCMAEAGTITVNDDGGGTNPFVVCFGEDIDVTSDGNFTLPPTGPAPDMVYLFYSCPPTGPDPEADPCWTSWFWTGNDIQTTNDGGIVNSVGINTFILVPTVIDNNQAPPAGPNIDSDGDMCWDINPDDTETFTFLNEIIITELDVDDCAGEVTLQITGGYPEFFPDTYSVSNTGAGSISQSGPDGGTITISGLMDGDNYSISLDDDGNGCSATFSGGPIDQDLTPPVLEYPEVCEGSSVLPSIASPGGGDFDFVVPPGDGASIDPSSGEVFDVLDKYTFTPTMSTTIYITELNEICETVPEPVDIILETPPTATFGEPSCYAGNTLYSIIITTDAANIVTSDGFVINNNDGTFTIEDIPSGALVMLTLENSTADCNSDVELPEFDCGCLPPAAPISGGDQTICAGEPLPTLSASAGPGETIDWYDAPTGGTLLATGTTYTPATAGTYYAEARILADDCTVVTPDCPCPVIADPVATTMLMICPGEPIPTLSVMVDAGQTADWYDAATGGLLLAAATLTYTPPSTGTYYVEARDPVNNCVSNRIAITISTHPAPSYTATGTSCAPDLSSYQVNLSLNNADQLVVNAGTPTDNGGGSWTVSGIPAGTDLNITISSSTTGCSLMDIITAPDCNCAVVMPPMSNGDATICQGDPIPTLSVSVNPGETVDWYDAPVGGTLLAMSNTNYSPPGAGTYYAETRVLVDGCVSPMRTAVTLTINPMPALVSVDTVCSIDLLTYTVTITLTDASSITASSGSINDEGGGVFTVSGIPTGTDLTFNAFNADMSCELGATVATSPQCPCPTIATPTANPVPSICPGNPIPTLSVNVESGLTADWYDDPVAGSQLAMGTTTFTPATDGTFYVEARDPVNNCLSERIALTITTNLNPTFVVNNAVCAADLLTYAVDIQVTNADQLTASAGTVMDNGGGNFVIDAIPAGTDVMISLSNSVTGCAIDDLISSPDCACGTVNPPVSGGDQQICSGAPIPALTADPGMGATIDWYDAPTAGTLLATGLTYTPAAAGIYYAETRVLVDDCVSFARTAITLTIDPTPTIDDVQSACAPNLQTYTVSLSTTNGSSVSTNLGTVVNTGGGTFSISGIPAGSDLTYTVFNSAMSCSVGPEIVIAPDCSCPTIDPPVSGGDRAICQGAPIPNLSVSVGMGETADWYDAPNAGTLLLSGSLTYMPAAAGTYYIEARNTVNNCVSERIAITLTINPLPSFVLVDTICAADLTTYEVELQVSDADQVVPSLGTLTDNGGGSFTISGIPSGNALNFSLNNTLTGCTISASVPAPDCSCEPVAAPISGGNVAICDGNPIPAITATVPAGVTIDWYDNAFGGTLLAPNTTSFTPPTAGTYFAEARVVVNGCLSAERTAITIIVNPTPALLNSEANCAPDLLTYTATLSFSDAASISVSNGVVSNDGAGTFTVSGIPAGENLSYTAFNAGMSCSIGPLNLDAPDCSCPAITAPINNGDVSICAGDAMPNLSVTLLPGQTADWYDDPLAGTLLLADSDNYTPPAIGTYYVEARDLVNNCVSERIAITINENTVAPPMSLGDQEICDGEDFPALAVQPFPNEVVDWYDAAEGGTLLATTNSFVPPGPGTYYAERRSLLNGCSSLTRTALTLMVFENPTLSVEQFTDPGCNDDDGAVSLSAAGGAMPYRFQRDGGSLQDSPSFGGLGVGNYNFTVVDDNGCTNNLEQALQAPDAVNASLSAEGIIDCINNSVSLDANGSSTGTNVVYTLSAPDGTSLPLDNLSALAEQAGMYTLTVLDTTTACTAMATTTVNADLQAPNADAGDDGLITCDSETASLSASSTTASDLSYSWQALEGGMISGGVNQPTIVAMAAGLYEVLITDLSNGCSSTDTVRVESIINTEIALNIVADNPDCAGDSNGSIILEAADPTATLLFAQDGGAFSFNNVFVGLAAGTYNFTVQDEFGCEVPTTVTLQDGINLTVDLGDDVYIKLGDSTTFNPILSVNPG
eukprot:g730.t1